MSINSRATEKGLSSSVVYYAMKVKGYDLDGALKYAEVNHKNQYFYNGMTLRRYCIQEGLNYKLILKHMYDGLSLPEAVGRYKKWQTLSKNWKGRYYKYFINGKPIKSLFDVNQYQRFLRLVKQGLSVAEAYKEVIKC